MKKLIIIVFVIFITDLSAQSLDRQIIICAGEGFSVANIEMPFTIRKAVVQSLTTGSLIIAPSFQQSETGFTLCIKAQALDIDFTYCRNPVTNDLFLNFAYGSMT
jgi:hypothetical protein